MLISLDLPEDLIQAIDNANEKVRLAPPVWPFGAAKNVTPKTLHDWDLVQKYYKELDIFRDTVARNRGKKIRSRSDLIRYTLTTLIAKNQLEECYQASLPPPPKYTPSSSLEKLEKMRKPLFALTLQKLVSHPPLQRAVEDEEVSKKTTS